MTDTELKQVLQKAEHVVTYVPLPGEPDIEAYLHDVLPDTHISHFPTDPTIDPFAHAQKCVEMYGETKVVMCIPGTQFDIFGNRKGCGGGWFDRFLSQVPKSWLRVGVTNEEALSHTRLDTNPWDEQMDVLLVLSQGDSWKFVSLEQNVNN